jgi:RNA-directed DNA polymerase
MRRQYEAIVPTARDRVVQAALKLVLEPIFEAGFKPCSHGFRPGRRAQDAIAEIRSLASAHYHWVLEGDITACFDEIDHRALMGRVRDRIGDKHVLDLVKAFLRAGVLSEDGVTRETYTGTPQGGILSPLLANIALSVLDDAFVRDWEDEMATKYQRNKRRQRGQPNYRLVRYADDFVVLVHGTRSDAETLCGHIAMVLATVGLRLSQAKTKIAHIDEGFDFLGYRVQRHRKRGTTKQFVYVYPSKASLLKVVARVKATCRQGINEPLSALLHRLNPVLRGWTNYFRFGVSKATFSYLRAYSWSRVVGWLRRKHPRTKWEWLRRHYLPRWWPADGGTAMFNPAGVGIRYVYFRRVVDATPWAPKVVTNPTT